MLVETFVHLASVALAFIYVVVTPLLFDVT